MVDDSKMLYKADNLWSKSVQLGVTSPNNAPVRDLVLDSKSNISEVHKGLEEE